MALLNRYHNMTTNIMAQPILTMAYTMAYTTALTRQVQEGAASLARAEREVLSAQSEAATAQLIAQGLAVTAMALLLMVGAVRIRAA